LTQGAGLRAAVVRAAVVRAAVIRAALAAGALLALACQTEATPEVQGEPSLTRATSAATPPRAAAAPAAAGSAQPLEKPQAQVGLAHYQEPSPASAPTAPPVPSAGAATPAADAPKAAAGATVQGTAVTEEPFSIWLQAASPIAAGTPATVEAVLVAKPPYHCNAEYPHKFKLGAAPAGLSYPEATVKGMKVTAERSVLSIPVQAQAAGKATVSGTLSFSVCTDERCLVEKRELALNLEVK
jgi:hypothetical protein